MTPMRRRLVWLLAAVMLLSPGSSASAEKPAVPPKASVVFRVSGVLTKKSRKGKKVKRILLPAFVQTALKPGDEVRTHARSRAEVRLGDGVLVRLKENTIFKIVRLKSSKDAFHVSLRLLGGKILLKVAKSLGQGFRVKVRTPTAVATVRGTMFIVDAQASKTEIKVLEGIVHADAVSAAARGAEKSAGRDVGAGQEIAALQGRPLSEPIPMSAPETEQETDWAKEPEMVATETEVEEESGSPEAEPDPSAAGSERSPEVVEPESSAAENPEVQQDETQDQPELDEPDE